MESTPPPAGSDGGRVLISSRGSYRRTSVGQIYGENLPPPGSDGGRFLHKFDREPNLWSQPLPRLVRMGEGSSINLIPNKIHHKMLEARAMVKF